MTTRTYQIIIGVLLVLVLILGWNVFRDKGEIKSQETEIVALSDEKESIRQSLIEMKNQYLEAETENQELNESILLEMAKIDSLIADIDKFKADDKKLRYEIAKWKKENNTLRGIMKGYLVEIDSLQRSNMELASEKAKISSELKTVSSEKNKLQQDVQNKDKVIKEGSVLQTLNLNSVPIRLRNNGNQVETSKASRVEKIKTCCTLYENRIAKAGLKNIYVRIISPEGSVLNNPSNPNATFNFNGVSGKYSAKREVNYQNQTIEGFCVFYDVSNAMATGLYKVEIYDEDAKIGTTEFELR